MQTFLRSMAITGVLTTTFYALTTIEYRSNEEFGLFSAAYAQAQDKPDDSPSTPEMAVSMAKNAFEYRDFKKVVGLLNPWVHPPRIADNKQMADARRLLGISQHILGDTKQAQEEFAQLIIIAPETELDPFVVPPAVIQSFEQVKKTVIGTSPKPRPAVKPETKTIIKEVVRVHPSVSLVPFAYAQLFALENQKAWGVTWFTTQAIGLILNVGGYWAANQLRTDRGLPTDRQEDFDNYIAGMYSGIAVWSVGYLGSAIQSYGVLSRLEQTSSDGLGTISGQREKDLRPAATIKLTLPFP